MYFEYRQNNSSGLFRYSEEFGVGQSVIIEADDLCSANRKAERVGLYFDGVDGGVDCNCCGDRWSKPWLGDPSPSHYGRHVGAVPDDKSTHVFTEPGQFYGFIHHKDGTVEGFWKNDEK